MARFEVPEVDYTRYSNRQLAAIPLVVLTVALLVIGGAYATTGAPVDPGLDFTGGTELRVAVDAPSDAQAREDIRAAFTATPDSIQRVGTSDVYIVTFQTEGTETAQNEFTQQLESEAGEAGFDVRSIEGVGAAFGSETQQRALIGVVAAFAGMAALVFALFRTFVPSIAVVVSAFSDIVIPVALMNALGIELTLGTVAALLMLIGYSVDSDILLNNSVLRRSGDFYESTYRAMRTGVTMTLTSIAAMAVMAIVATFFGIGLLASIGTILVFGLVADLMNTYLLNVSLLRWYKYEGVAR